MEGGAPLSPPKVPPFPPPPPPISLLFQHMCNIYIPVFICLYIFPLSSSPVPADILSSFSSPTTVASLPSYERTYSPVWPFACDIRRLILTRAYYETGKLCRCFLNKAGNEHRTLKLSNPSSRQHLRTYSNETEQHPSSRPKRLDSRPPTAQKNEAESLSVFPLPLSLASSLSFFPPPPLLSLPSALRPSPSCSLSAFPFFFFLLLLSLPRM